MKPTNLLLRPASFAASLSLLLSVLSCAKKDDSPPAPTASYQHDGVAVTCSVEAHRTTSVDPSTNTSYDQLELDLTTTPQPASGSELLRLYFYKQSGQPASAYVPQQTFTLLQNRTSLSYFTREAATITQGSDGSFAGSFSAKVLPPGSIPPGPDLAIANGVFSNVRL